MARTAPPLPPPPPRCNSSADAIRPALTQAPSRKGQRHRQLCHLNGPAQSGSLIRGARQIAEQTRTPTSYRPAAQCGALLQLGSDSSLCLERGKVSPRPTCRLSRGPGGGSSEERASESGARSRFPKFIGTSLGQLSSSSWPPRPRPQLHGVRRPSHAGRRCAPACDDPPSHCEQARRALHFHRPASRSPSESGRPPPSQRVCGSSSTPSIWPALHARSRRRRSGPAVRGPLAGRLASAKPVLQLRGFPPAAERGGPCLCLYLPRSTRRATWRCESAADATLLASRTVVGHAKRPVAAVAHSVARRPIALAGESRLTPAGFSPLRTYNAQKRE